MKKEDYKERFLRMHKQLQCAFPGMRISVAWHDEQNTPPQTRAMLSDIIENVEKGNVNNWPKPHYLIIGSQLGFGFLNWVVKDEAGKTIKTISGKQFDASDIQIRPTSKGSPLRELCIEEKEADAEGMIVAYGIAGCIIMQKPFRECLNWYGVDPEGKGMRTFKERYSTDEKLFLLVKGEVVNKCNLWSEVFLEPYPTIDTSMVLLLTGKYRDEFRRISPEEREGIEILPEWPGVREYIQEILEDYYDFQGITMLKVISGPPLPESSLRRENVIHNAIYDKDDKTKEEQSNVSEEASPATEDEDRTLGEICSDMMLSIGKLHITCLELSIRLFDIGLRFLFGIR